MLKKLPRSARSFFFQSRLSVWSRRAARSFSPRKRDRLDEVLIGRWLMNKIITRALAALEKCAISSRRQTPDNIVAGNKRKLNLAKERGGGWNSLLF
jgi:hypothetical protein